MIYKGECISVPCGMRNGTIIPMPELHPKSLFRRCVIDSPDTYHWEFSDDISDFQDTVHFDVDGELIADLFGECWSAEHYDLILLYLSTRVRKIQ